MTSPDTDARSELAGRYGAPGRGRLLTIVASVAVAVAFLSWLAWAAWFHSTPEVSSNLATNRVVDEHTATAIVEVDLDEDAEDVSCRIHALAADHSVVGVLDFEPVDGRNEVTITTEREATAIQLLGCTANGQSRPR